MSERQETEGSAKPNESMLNSSTTLLTCCIFGRFSAVFWFLWSCQQGISTSGYEVFIEDFSDEVRFWQVESFRIFSPPAEIPGRCASF